MLFVIFVARNWNINFFRNTKDHPVKKATLAKREKLEAKAKKETMATVVSPAFKGQEDIW